MSIPKSPRVRFKQFIDTPASPTIPQCRSPHHLVPLFNQINLICTIDPYKKCSGNTSKSEEEKKLL